MSDACERAEGTTACRPERSEGVSKDVDFVEDDDPDGPDEELPQHPPRSRIEAWRPQVEQFLRGRYGLPAVVVLVVLALLIGRALLHEKPAGAPSPSPTPSSASSVTLDPSTGRPVVLPRRTGTDPTRCPGLQCYTTSSAPAAVRAAIRARFPAAKVTAAETVRLVDRAQADPLWYREVDVRVGTGTLTVRVQAHATGDNPGGGAKDDGHQAVTYVDASSGQWYVRLQMTDRSGTPEPFDQLSSLVDDTRLLQV